jgi:hypothetical protein
MLQECENMMAVNVGASYMPDEWIQTFVGQTKARHKHQETKEFGGEVLQWLDWCTNHCRSSKLDANVSPSKQTNETQAKEQGFCLWLSCRYKVAPNGPC